MYILCSHFLKNKYLQAGKILGMVIASYLLTVYQLSIINYKDILKYDQKSRTR